MLNDASPINSTKLIILIGTILLLLVSLRDISIMQLEINPAFMHFFNSLLLFSILFRIKSNPKLLWNLIVMTLLVFSYELVKHLSLKYYKFGLFHLLYFLIYSTFVFVSLKYLKREKVKFRFSLSLSVYSFLWLISMLLGHVHLFGLNFFE